MVYVLWSLAGIVGLAVFLALAFYAFCCWCEYVDARDGVLRHFPTLPQSNPPTAEGHSTRKI